MNSIPRVSVQEFLRSPIDTYSRVHVDRNAKAVNPHRRVKALPEIRRDPLKGRSVHDLYPPGALAYSPPSDHVPLYLPPIDLCDHYECRDTAVCFYQ